MIREKFTHFSHHHTLREFIAKEESRIACSACELILSGPSFKCSSDKTCRFFLHKSCFELPQKIKHNSHPAHLLTLLSSSRQGAKCDACGDLVTAFAYRCIECDYDVHTKCACLPVSVTREDHQHPLRLCYSVAYDAEKTELVCDACDDTIEHGCWVYFCSYCNFGTHLVCKTTTVTEEEEEEEVVVKQYKKKGQKEDVGSITEGIAPVKELIEAQLEAQANMLRMQMEMQNRHHQHQIMRDHHKTMLDMI